MAVKSLLYCYRALWPPQPFEHMHKQAVAVVVEFLLAFEIRPLPLLLLEILLLAFEIRPLPLLPSPASRNPPPQYRNNSSVSLSLLQSTIDRGHRYTIT